MANTFFSEPNPTLDKIVRESVTFDALKDALHKAQGMVSEEETIVNSGYRPAPTESVAPLSAPKVAASDAMPTCIRVIYPGGNDRFEICGMSESELDQKESALRAMYSK
jgi:hypothetical protein